MWLLVSSGTLSILMGRGGSVFTTTWRVYHPNHWQDPCSQNKQAMVSLIRPTRINAEGQLYTIMHKIAKKSVFGMNIGMDMNIHWKKHMSTLSCDCFGLPLDWVICNILLICWISVSSKLFNKYLQIHLQIWIKYFHSNYLTFVEKIVPYIGVEVNSSPVQTRSERFCWCFWAFICIYYNFPKLKKTQQRL